MLERYLIEIQNDKLSLAPFSVETDLDYYKNLPGRNEIYFTHYGKDKRHIGTYYILMYQGKRAGMVGVVLIRDKYYYQILIHPDYRGKGLLLESAKLVAKKHKIKRMYAKILHRNKISYKAHIKAGFKEFPEEEIKRLHELGTLSKNATLLYMDF